MLSVVIPTLNAAATLPLTLAAVRDADEVIVSDGGSSDGTLACVAAPYPSPHPLPQGEGGYSESLPQGEGEGKRIVAGEPGRGGQLARGAAAAGGDWLLFLHADTRLAAGWRDAVAAFIADPGNLDRAAAFRLAFADPRPAARALESWVAWRCRTFGLPYGDQGLLISRRLYDAVGGYRPLPLMEDVDMVRRIGRHRIVMLDVEALTSAARYRRGYLMRGAGNLGCLALYGLGVPPRLIARLYG